MSQDQCGFDKFSLQGTFTVSSAAVSRSPEVVAELDPDCPGPQAIVVKVGLPSESVIIRQVAHKKIDIKILDLNASACINFYVVTCTEYRCFQEIAVKLAGIKRVDTYESAMTGKIKVVLKAEICAHRGRPWKARTILRT
jgi:hypothetical protein